MTARTIAALGLVVCLGGASVLAPAGAWAGSSRGKILIVNNGSGTLTIIDTAKKVVLKDAIVGNHPSKVVSDSQGRFAYVINPGSDDLSIVDLAKLSVLNVPLGFQPSDLALTPNDTAVVILHAEPDVASGGNQFKGDYSIYDVKQQGVVATNRLGGLGAGDHEPCGIVADNSGDAVWITACAASKVVLIDLRKARQGASGDEVRAVVDAQANPMDTVITPR